MNVSSSLPSKCKKLYGSFTYRYKLHKTNKTLLHTKQQRVINGIKVKQKPLTSTKKHKTTNHLTQ